jgi:bifunctional isochorismate lyase/aryl carrier protein
LRQVARTCGVVTTARELLLAFHVAHLRTELRELLPGEAASIELDDDLSDHGLDSVRAIELIDRALPRGQRHDFETLVEARSLRALAELMLPLANETRPEEATAKGAPACNRV